MSELKTGVTFYEDMIKHHCLWDPNYPECPERFSCVLKRCQELNLIDRCVRVPFRDATEEEIKSKHNPDLIRLLDECRNKTAEELEEISSHYDSIFICSETFKLAKIAAGSVINLVKEICDGNILNGMAIVRPPGHHAMKSAYCGYCFFNNVALAADYALKNYNLNRILIVDWDVHHGQATQQMFYDDKRILYFSIHRYEYGTFWPNLRESDYDYIGEGSAKGYNFNIPLNKTGLGNSEYLSIFHDILLPVAIEYEPELIIISAGYDAAVGCFEFEPQMVLISGGYDAAVGDTKGEMKVTPACYAHLVKSLSHLANGKIAVILEGGYFLTSLAEGAALSLRALLGDPTPMIEPTEAPDENLLETIRNVIYSHRKEWNCFKIYDSFTPSRSLLPNYHFPVIKFDYNEKPLEVFPTRDAYLVQSNELRQQLENILKNLRINTNLFKPKFKCVLISDSNGPDKIVDRIVQNSVNAMKNGYSEVEHFFSSLEIENVEWEEFSQWNDNFQHIFNENIYKYDTSILQILLKTSNHIFNNLTSSTLCDVPENIENIDVSHHTRVFCDHVFEQYNIKRFLVIDLYLGNDTIQDLNTKNYEVLCFKLSEHNHSPSDGKFNISLNYNNLSECKVQRNFEHIVLWLKTVLPISYQFQPEVILIYLNFKQFRNCSSPELLSYLIHWLSALANGRMVLVTKRNKDNFDNLAFMYICKQLTGNVIPVLKFNVARDEDMNIIKELNRKLEKDWSLNSFVKFPE